jgi:hypothetical protein
VCIFFGREKSFCWKITFSTQIVAIARVKTWTTERDLRNYFRLYASFCFRHFKFLLFADILNLNNFVLSSDFDGSTYFPPVLRPTGTSYFQKAFWLFVLHRNEFSAAVNNLLGAFSGRIFSRN